jgi:hypothetical protein
VKIEKIYRAGTTELKDGDTILFSVEDRMGNTRFEMQGVFFDGRINCGTSIWDYREIIYIGKV